MQSLSVPVTATMNHAQQLARPGQTPIGRGADTLSPTGTLIPPQPLAAGGNIPAVTAAAACAVAPRADEFTHAALPNLRVIPSLCKIGGGGTLSEIVVESLLTNDNHRRGFANAIEELQGPNSRELALRFASTYGMRAPTLNRIPAPYAVTREGEPCKPGDAPYRYRTVVLVQEGGRF